MAYDLHSHTHYSDGRYSPAELIAEAARRGVRVLAITDHDNTRGTREAQPLAAAAGIRLIPAVELTTRWPGADLPPHQADVDLLGYGIDLDDPHWQAFERATLSDLHARMAEACARLTQAGYPLSLEDVLAQNPRYPGLMQLIHTLIRLGYGAGWEEAALLGEPSWWAGRQSPFTIRMAIEQIHLAGGRAVLAHPSIVQPEGQLMPARWLAQLVDWGLDGVEIYHPRLDEPTRAHFLALARQMNLAVTGGSDTHGWFEGFSRLGQLPVTAEMVTALGV